MPRSDRLEFYEEFAHRYDDLAWSAERYDAEATFFDTLFERHGDGIERVLDCACGTGRHVVAFRDRLGLAAVGSDASPAMVDRARRVAAEHGVDAEFVVEDFRTLTDTFGAGEFDAVVCVGNSLPHLESRAAVRRALTEMHALLREGGLLVVEQRNFDRLLARRERFLPIAVTEDEAFVYALDYGSDTITFNVLALDLESGEIDVYSTEYYPLQRSELRDCLTDAGFDDLEWYGGAELRELDIERDSTYAVVCET